MSQEVELKLALPAAALPALKKHPLLRQAEAVGRAVTLANTYYDTPEMALSDARIALRTRKQGRRWLQTIKGYRASLGGLSSRPEWEQPYLGAFDFSHVDDETTRHELEARADALTPLFTTDFRRETRCLRPAPEVEILLMLDRGSITAGERSEAICELELELVRGSAGDLYKLARTLAETLPLRPEDDSKAERGLRLYRDETRLPLKAGPSPLAAGQSPLQAFRAVAFDCLRQWQRNGSGAAVSDAPEFVHQMRVGLRRLRSALKLFAPALPAVWAQHWSDELGQAADELGEARDIDVLHEELLAPILTDNACPPTVQALAGQVIAARDEARRHVRSHLNGPGQGRRMLGFAAEASELCGTTLDASADLTAFARLQLDDLRKRARKRWRRAAGGDAAALHELRIALKRLRYAIEFFAPLFPPRRAKTFQGALSRAQEALGYLNDVEVGNARLAGWAGDDPVLREGATFVAGWHAALGRRVRRRILPRVAELLDGRPPWRK